MQNLVPRLHHLMMRHMIETGHPPEFPRLCELAALPAGEVERGIRELERMHGVILVPGTLRIWSLHPFAAMPTRFWVSTGKNGWWANCGWCALAVGAMLEEDITVTTGEGGEGRAIEFRVANGQASDPELLLHFPYPPARWWENPLCPCANILFFRSESAIEEWCLRHHHPRGSALSMEKAVRLAGLWFGDYASPDWRRKTPEQAAAIFAELGLDPDFWTMPASFR